MGLQPHDIFFSADLYYNCVIITLLLFEGLKHNSTSGPLSKCERANGIYREYRLAYYFLRFFNIIGHWLYVCAHKTVAKLNTLIILIFSIKFKSHVQMLIIKRFLVIYIQLPSINLLMALYQNDVICYEPSQGLRS